MTKVWPRSSCRWIQERCIHACINCLAGMMENSVFRSWFYMPGISLLWLWYACDRERDRKEIGICSGWDIIAGDKRRRSRKSRRISKEEEEWEEVPYICGWACGVWMYPCELVWGALMKCVEWFWKRYSVASHLCVHCKCVHRRH